MKLKDTPIQGKLMSVILLCCAVVLLIMCTGYIIFEYVNFKENLKSQVSTLGNVIATNSSASLAFDSPKDANEILQALSADQHIVAASLYDSKGNIFAKYKTTKAIQLWPASPGDIGFEFEKGHLSGFVPVMQQKEKVGTLYICSDMEAMFAQLKGYAILAIILFCISLFVAYLLSRILRKEIAQPLMALEQTAKIISEKRDYSVRANRFGNDEVGSLTDAFNDMLARIQLQNLEINSFNANLERNVRDRTNELQLAYNDLKQQRDFVETILDASVYIIAVLDQDMKFSSINKKCEDAYGISKAKILGQSYLEVFPQASGSKAHLDILKALKGESVHNTAADSAIIGGYFENYYIPLKNTDDVYGVLVLSLDITETRATNERLKELNFELEKSNRDLEQFAFIASHDLQEPLRKIHIFNDLLGENFDNQENMRMYQEKIKQSAGRMHDLIMDVLDFSRLSKVDSVFSYTDLNEVIKNLKSDYELMIAERRAKINYENLPIIPAVPLQMSQLFSNLISNSLKYSDQDPEINIASQKMTSAEVKQYAKLKPEFSYVKIMFSDNGIGFEPKYNEQIFTIFQRLHGKQSYSGTGIGLALCRKIAENHHGLISAEGALNKGAVFTIILPTGQPG